MNNSIQRAIAKVISTKSVKTVAKLIDTVTGDKVILKQQTTGSWKHVKGKYHSTIPLFCTSLHILLFTLIIISAVLNERGLGPLGSRGYVAHGLAPVWFCISPSKADWLHLAT